MNIKLSDYAKMFNVTYRTAWNRYKKGKIKNAYMDETKHVIISLDEQNNEKTAIIYARVSNANRKDNLERQVEKLINYSTNNGYTIKKISKEIASGLNDNRKQLNNILNDNSWNYLIVENKDRLTRFGFNYIKILLSLNNKHIVVVNETNDSKTDLIQDLVSIIYSFSARIYGLRKAKNKQKEILQIINNEID